MKRVCHCTYLDWIVSYFVQRFKDLGDFVHLRKKFACIPFFVFQLMKSYARANANFHFIPKLLTTVTKTSTCHRKSLCGTTASIVQIVLCQDGLYASKQPPLYMQGLLGLTPSLLQSHNSMYYSKFMEKWKSYGVDQRIAVSILKINKRAF